MLPKPPRSQAKTRNRQAGVTLLEVMIVLAIMALVIGVATPRLIDTFGRAKSQAAEVQMSNIKGALQMYYIDVGTLPTTTQGLSALVLQPQSVSGWRGPYLNSAEDLIDPWGRRYQLKVPGENTPFELISFGRDGQPGGTNEDSDLKF